MPLTTLYKELQRRNVIQAAISYTVGSWVILQVGQLLFPLINVPESALGMILIALIILFPVWLVFAWVYEYTPKGFKKTELVKEEETITRTTSKKLNTIIFGGMALAIMLLLTDRIFNISRNMLDNSEELSIAVLPFENKGSDEDAYFADGISEDILTQLGKIGALKVLSRFTLKDYDTKGKTPSQIGKELKVSYLLSGSVRRDGDALRIGCQLISTKDETEAWSENYDRVMKDIFHIQSEVAQNIAGKLKAELNPEEKTRIEKAPTDNLIAYNLYLRGREAYSQYTTEGMKEALELFKQAIAEDEAFALAWAGLGDAYAQLVWRNDWSLAYLDTALVIAKKAISLDGEAAEGWKTLGLAYRYKGNTTKAIEANLRALEKNPNHSPAIGNLASRYASQGKLVEAIRMYHREFDLNPINPLGFKDLGYAYLLLGLYEQALSNYQTANQLNPDFFAPYRNLAQSYLYKRDNVRATEYLERLLQLDSNNVSYLESVTNQTVVYDQDRAQAYIEKLLILPGYDPRKNWMVPVIQGYLLMVRGDTTQAKAVLNEQLALMKEIMKQGNESSFFILTVSEVYGTLGEKENCIRWIEKAEEAGWLDYKYLELYPFYDSVREDSRFQAIIQRMQKKVTKMREQVLEMEMEMGLKR